MGGSAALTLAAYHRDQFKFAGSLSGYLNISAPGMREAIRIAMLDAGRYNVDSMWGPPWNPAWLRNDPFVFATAASGLPMYIRRPAAAGRQRHPRPRRGLQHRTAMALEALQRSNTRAFQPRGAVAGEHPAVPVPDGGTHSGANWRRQLYSSPPILDAHPRVAVTWLAATQIHRIVGLAHFGNTIG